MDNELILQMIVLLSCIILSALFSASETAITSLSRVRLERMIEEKLKGVRTLENLYKNPNKVLSAILIGNNIVNIGASSLATMVSIEIFGNKGVGIATGVMTLIILIFSEITPKSIAANSSEKLSLKLAPFVQFFLTILNPIICFLDKITGFLIRILGGNVDKNKPSVTQEELMTMVNVGYREGVFEDSERELIDNIFRFSNYNVNDIMIPRTQVVAVDINSSFKEIRSVINKYKYSRIPVYNETLDDIKGVLYLKDLIFLSKEEINNFKISNHIRPAYIIPEYMPIKKLFEKLKNDNIHMAIVVNEFGGTDGIITIEDLMEEIVGDIYDEFDDEDREIIKISNKEFLMDGQIKLDSINKFLGLNLHSEEYSVLSGFIIEKLDRIPSEKEELLYENLKFIVEKIDKNRIKLVRIKIA